MATIQKNHRGQTDQRRNNVRVNSHAKNRCVDGKIRYRDHDEAVNALHHAQNMRVIATELTGSSTRNEKRTYFCGLCKGHHLTSQEERQGAKAAA
jgi:hypothetical protein